MKSFLLYLYQKLFIQKKVIEKKFSLENILAVLKILKDKEERLRMWFIELIGNFKMLIDLIHRWSFTSAGPLVIHELSESSSFTSNSRTEFIFLRKEGVLYELYWIMRGPWAWEFIENCVVTTYVVQTQKIITTSFDRNTFMEGLDPNAACNDNNDCQDEEFVHDLKLYEKWTWKIEKLENWS